MIWSTVMEMQSLVSLIRTGFEEKKTSFLYIFVFHISRSDG